MISLRQEKKACAIISPQMPKTILIIEDDLFISKTISDKLKKNGLEVSSAKDAREAEQVLEKNTPDLILLDIILPQVNGIELLKRLKSDPKTKSIPVVVFSNLGSKEEVQEAMDLGATEYLIKATFSPDEVVEKVKKILS